MVFGLDADFCGIQGSQTGAYHSLWVPGPSPSHSSLKIMSLCASEWEAEAADSLPHASAWARACLGPTASTTPPPPPADGAQANPMLHSCPGFCRKSSRVPPRPEFIYTFKGGVLGVQRKPRAHLRSWAAPGHLPGAQSISPATPVPTPMAY